MLAALLLTLAAPGPAVDVFTAGTGGAAAYRIPGLVVTARGTLLAYCEARQAGGDWAAIGLVARRSTDGGKTWSPQAPLPAAPGPHRKNPVAQRLKGVDPAAVTHNNPVAVADPAGPVHLLFCVEYRRCFYCRSDDDGATFSPPADVTAAFDAFTPDYPWQVLATGPGHGIRLRGGRLVVPVWLSRGTGGNGHRPSVAATVVSDDGGRTWRRGAIAAGETDPLTNPSETAAVELADGRVLLSVRHESAHRHRGVVVGPDGAGGWGRPAFDDALPEPVCMAGLVRVPGGGLVFTNPHADRRRNLTARLSTDDAATWSAGRVLDPGAAGYSDLAATADGTVYCLYERGDPGARAAGPVRALSLLTFTTAWLAGGAKPPA